MISWCDTAAAVHGRVRAYLARFGHGAMLGDDYAMLITGRQTTAPMRVMLTVDEADHDLALELPVGDSDHAEIDALAGAVFAEAARLLAGLPATKREAL